jgi:hypothetical protein
MGILFNKYGSMILKKDTVLYHVSDSKEFDSKNSREKPFLFCTFHPSEWFGYKYVHFIKLQKDVRLFFMIKEIINDRIISALPDIITNQKNNLAKMNLEVLTKMKVILEKEYFNGWFSSIENKTTVEVALLSGKNIYECIGSEKIVKAWRNGNCSNDGKNIICKVWKERYKLSFLEKIIKLRINKRYKKIFEKYKKYEQKSKYIHEYVFQIILDNANIKYH